MADELKHGLEGVLVDESELSEINGDTGRLIYPMTCGFNIVDNGVAWCRWSLNTLGNVLRD